MAPGLRWHGRLFRIIAKGMRYFLTGLYYQAPTFEVHVARALAKQSFQPADETAEQIGPLITYGPPRQFLPHGHPEALANLIPLSPSEQELWADLLDERFGGKARPGS